VLTTKLMTGILKLILDITYVSLDWHAYQSNNWTYLLVLVTAATNISFVEVLYKGSKGPGNFRGQLT